MRAIVIKHAEGLWYIETPSVSATGTTLEKALTNVDPGAPDERISPCAEFLTGLMGPESHSHVVTGLADTTDL